MSDEDDVEIAPLPNPAGFGQTVQFDMSTYMDGEFYWPTYITISLPPINQSESNTS